LQASPTALTVPNRRLVQQLVNHTEIRHPHQLLGTQPTSGRIDWAFEIARTARPAAVDIRFGPLIDHFSEIGIGRQHRIQAFEFQ
jgi:hypothetical protein